MVKSLFHMQINNTWRQHSIYTYHWLWEIIESTVHRWLYFAFLKDEKPGVVCFLSSSKLYGWNYWGKNINKMLLPVRQQDGQLLWQQINTVHHTSRSERQTKNISVTPHLWTQLLMVSWEMALGYCTPKDAYITSWSSRTLVNEFGSDWSKRKQRTSHFLLFSNSLSTWSQAMSHN